MNRDRLKLRNGDRIGNRLAVNHVGRADVPDLDLDRFAIYADWLARRSRKRT